MNVVHLIRSLILRILARVQINALTYARHANLVTPCSVNCHTDGFQSLP